MPSTNRSQQPRSNETTTKRCRSSVAPHLVTAAQISQGVIHACPVITHSTSAAFCIAAPCCHVTLTCILCVLAWTLMMLRTSAASAARLQAKQASMHWVCINTADSTRFKHHSSVIRLSPLTDDLRLLARVLARLLPHSSTASPGWRYRSWSWPCCTALGMAATTLQRSRRP